MFDSDNDYCTNEELLVNLFDTLPCIDDVPENHFINIFHPQFPSNEEGIVAFGGDMSTSRLLAAYASGVFPMPIEGLLLWWSFFPRLIIFPEKAHFSKSLLQKINTKNYEVKIDTNFRSVIKYCQTIPRPYGWITDDVVEAYIQLHDLGFAHSFETYENNKLVGGLYGVSIGKMFAGESMFHLQNDTSKIAFFHLIRFAQQNNIHFIDCQQDSKHFRQWGGELFDKNTFKVILEKAIAEDSLIGKWNIL